MHISTSQQVFEPALTMGPVLLDEAGGVFAHSTQPPLDSWLPEHLGAFSPTSILDQGRGSPVRAFCWGHMSGCCRQLKSCFTQESWQKVQASESILSHEQWGSGG